MSACPKPSFKRVKDKVAKIVLQDEKCCWECGQVHSLQSHHAFSGTSNRAMSGRYNLVVWLCMYHHLDSKAGVHFNQKFRDKLQEFAKQEFIKVYNEELFYKEFRGIFKC